MTKLSLRDLSLRGQRVLMRVDFNTPMDEQGHITDDSRIRATLPSIEYILRQGGKLILMSHLGRPDGKPDPKYTLAPIRERLSQLLHKPVLFAPDAIGSDTTRLKDGEILLLENVRFHPGEEEPAKEPHFVNELAKLGDLFVQDAFGSAHRAHSSTALIASHFPNASAAGFLLEKEIQALSQLIHHPRHPFFVVMGGAKIAGKIGVMKKLLKTVDRLFVGGGMAYPFLKAKHLSIGASPSEKGAEAMAQELLATFGDKIALPVDLVVADAFSNDAKTKVIEVKDGIAVGWQGMDIGPKTIRQWSEELQRGATIFWNGPLGVYEMAHFLEGTKQIAKSLSKAAGNVIVGGGDSVAAIAKSGIDEALFDHISMGGGATLEYIELEGHLPGIDCLTDKTP